MLWNHTTSTKVALIAPTKFSTNVTHNAGLKIGSRSYLNSQRAAGSGDFENSQFSGDLDEAMILRP